MNLCKCEYCFKEFRVNVRASRHCSAACRASDYAKNNKEKVKSYKDSYYKLNKDKICSDNMSNYYANKPTLDKRICKHCFTEFQPTRVDNEFCSRNCGSAFWRSNHKEYVYEDQKHRYHNDTNRKLSTCLRSRLNKALKGNVKSQRTMELLGCSIEEFKDHLESQFEPWMNWENHGNYDPHRKTWQMDHVVPMSVFDLSDPKQQEEACRYTNIQPILAKNNLIKGGKYE